MNFNVKTWWKLSDMGTKIRATAAMLAVILLVIGFLQLAFCSTAKADEPGDPMKLTPVAFTYVNAGVGITNSNELTPVGVLGRTFYAKGGERLAVEGSVSHEGGAVDVFAQQRIATNGTRYMIGIGMMKNGPTFTVGANHGKYTARLKFFEGDGSAGDTTCYEHHHREHCITGPSTSGPSALFSLGVSMPVSR